MAGKNAKDAPKEASEDFKMPPKNRFQEGEKVLCFHGPLLYVAKCLQSRYDEKNKTPEYLIHYSGWNKSWDEWVPECRVLKHNDANLSKQKDLYKAQKAEPSKRRKNFKKSLELGVGGGPDIPPDSAPSTPVPPSQGGKGGAGGGRGGGEGSSNEIDLRQAIVKRARKTDATILYNVTIPIVPLDKETYLVNKGKLIEEKQRLLREELKMMRERHHEEISLKKEELKMLQDRFDEEILLKREELQMISERHDQEILFLKERRQNEESRHAEEMLLLKKRREHEEKLHALLMGSTTQDEDLGLKME